MSEPDKKLDIRDVHPSSGNVFADLGLPDADQLLADSSAGVLAKVCGRLFRDARPSLAYVGRVPGHLVGTGGDGGPRRVPGHRKAGRMARRGY